jgi:hypothetical protein
MTDVAKAMHAPTIPDSTVFAVSSNIPTSPTSPGSPKSPSSPGSISPVELDAKLQFYVNLYGVRWPLIRAHMQCAFQTAFPTKYLEHRWQVIVAEQQAVIEPDAESIERSPLASIDGIIPAEPLLPSNTGNCGGIQERLPLKRCYDGKPDSPTQPSRPPPPPSPCTVPKALLGRRCPTFLLAPGSALSAPDNVRRQLKAVYLASKLHENRFSSENASDGSCAGASDEEKSAIVALLSREMACFKKKGMLGPPSGLGSSGGSGLARSVLATTGAPDVIPDRAERPPPRSKITGTGTGTGPVHVHSSSPTGWRATSTACMR